MTIDKLFTPGKRRPRVTRFCMCGCGKTFTTSFPEKRFLNSTHRHRAWRKENVTERAGTFDPFYGSAEWAQLRTSVIERDNYTCVVCGEKPEKPKVHHILSRRKGGPDRISNLVTVCSSCHARIHAADE